MMLNKVLIDDLQRIDAGLTQVITPQIQDAITIHRKTKSKLCTTCEADVTICHHIKLYSQQRLYNGDEAALIESSRYKNLIIICPNCHHRIHNDNPYYLRVEKNKQFMVQVEQHQLYMRRLMSNVKVRKNTSKPLSESWISKVRGGNIKSHTT